MNRKHFDVAVIGGGASGTLSAIQLLRQELPVVAHIFNDEFEMGRGVAYSAPSSRLVLNVPARNMSAFPDLRAHFTEWLQDHYGTLYTGDSFVPRLIYGDYLRDTFQATAKNSRLGSLCIYNSRARELRPHKHGYVLSSDDSEIFADAVILALGNMPPANPELHDKTFTTDPRYILNPWKQVERVLGICGDETVVILGAGLTSVDMILQLRQQGHRGNIILMSRHGLRPSAHRPGLTPHNVGAGDLKGLSPRRLIRILRKKVRIVESQGGDWRQIVDGLRSEINNIWAEWTYPQRQSFARHLQPYWEVHRHRVCPDVGDLMEEEIKTGRMQLKAGRLVAIRSDLNGLVVALRLRGQRAMEEMKAGFVINCTGSKTLQGSCVPDLIQFLVEQKLGQIDPLGYGLMTAPNGNLMDATGRAGHGLYMIGPLRRGKLWETTAIPEIRAQADSIVREICRSLTTN